MFASKPQRRGSNRFGPDWLAGKKIELESMRSQVINDDLKPLYNAMVDILEYLLLETDANYSDILFKKFEDFENHLTNVPTSTDVSGLHCSLKNEILDDLHLKFKELQEIMIYKNPNNVELKTKMENIENELDDLRNALLIKLTGLERDNRDLMSVLADHSSKLDALMKVTNESNSTISSAKEIVGQTRTMVVADLFTSSTTLLLVGIFGALVLLARK